MRLRNKVTSLCKDKRGESSLYPLIIVLVVLLICSVLFEYFRLMTIATGVRNSVQSAVISVATDNWNETYPGLREGYSGGYERTSTSWSTNISSGNVYRRLSEELGLTKAGNYYIKDVDGVMEYRISELAVEITNTPFAPSSQEAVNTFYAEGSIVVEVPLSFGWESLPPMHICMKLKAGFEPKF